MKDVPIIPKMQDAMMHGKMRYLVYNILNLIFHALLCLKEFHCILVHDKRYKDS
jgi:hypothetical protein